MTPLLKKILKNGWLWTILAICRYVVRRMLLIKTLFAKAYRNPTDEELTYIEAQLVQIGIPIHDYFASVDAFVKFKDLFLFPQDYYGGIQSEVWDEKLLEHFVSFDLLNLSSKNSQPYVDVANCMSPWTRMLREKGYESYSIDLIKSEQFKDLNYYIKGDATNSCFESDSISSASLQCAFEMFVKDDDHKLIKEFARILKDKGKVVISPLYMHTSACFYQTPDYYGRDYGDAGAQRLIRRDCWGIPASRKYSAETFKKRVWDVALSFGLKPRLYVLRNKDTLGKNIYMHFILMIEK